MHPYHHIESINTTLATCWTNSTSKGSSHQKIWASKEWWIYPPIVLWGRRSFAGWCEPQPQNTTVGGWNPGVAQALRLRASHSLTISNLQPFDSWEMYGNAKFLPLPRPTYVCLLQNIADGPNLHEGTMWFKWMDPFSSLQSSKTCQTWKSTAHSDTEASTFRGSCYFNIL